MTETTENKVEETTQTTSTSLEKQKKRLPVLWTLLTVSVVGIGVGTYFAAPQIKGYLEKLKAPFPAPTVLPVPETVPIVSEPMIPQKLYEEQRTILLETQQNIQDACDEDKKGLENKILTIKQEADLLQKELEMLQKQLVTLQNAPQQDLTKQALRLTDLLTHINDGKPFAAFLTDLRNGMPSNQLLKQIDEQLGYAAATGIPTVAEIQKTFTQNASDYETVVMTCEEIRSHWYGKVWLKLKKLVRIRPVVIPDDATCPRWLFYKASDEIRAGKIGQALITLRSLPTKKQEIFLPLINQIELRLKLTHLLSETGENK